MYCMFRNINSGGPVALPDFLGLCGGARPSNQSRTFLDFQGRDAAAAAPRAEARLPVASVSSWAGQWAVGSVAQLSPAQLKSRLMGYAYYRLSGQRREKRILKSSGNIRHFTYFHRQLTKK